ncbi:MAG: excinuclease ABC subunit UvrA [Planctomycetota bacterium]|nr:excinuclease ABC subunit UvrA [Planctomycetota bacterium]
MVIRVSAKANPESLSRIRICRARTNNLKDVSIEIPRDCLVVITGRSGSGKSSLAIDTLFAEGQRQYIESLSIYARQFFDQSSRADVEIVEGLLPTICLDQKPVSVGPRSTVGTVAEIYDYLRVLMARAADIHCHQCGEPIRQQSIDQIVQSVLGLPENTKLMVMAPLVAGRKGKHLEIFQQIRDERLVRLRLDGEILDIEQIPELSGKKNATIEAITDRIIIRPGIENRLFESIELAARMSGGQVLACYQLRESEGEVSPWEDRLFSTEYACPKCEIGYAEVQPRTFSFNSPYGACPQCDGLGYLEQFATELIVPDRNLSLEEGAVLPWKGLTPKKRLGWLQQLQPLMSALSVETSTPLRELAPAAWKKLLNSRSPKAPGIRVLLEKELATALQESRQESLRSLQTQSPCPECEGCRLNRQARAARLSGRSISQLTEMSITELRLFLESVSFKDHRQQVAGGVIDEICKRLRFLEKVGVAYLTLNRSADSLSGGETERVRLATAIGGGLANVCYVLDEPTVGLHPRDNERLISAIQELQAQGNSVVIVEHDETMIRSADHLIDVGPGAGADGGRIVAQGSVDEITECPDSLTGQYLSGKRAIETPVQRRPVTPSRCLSLEKASGNNLKDVDVTFPLGLFNCVTGVSGSGKSSLVNGTLAPLLRRKLGLSATHVLPCQTLRGSQEVDKLVQVDQKPIGRTPRGCAATYSGVFDEIRKVFASTKLARQRGFGVSRFSFNSKSGWCPECQGYGMRRITMNFLPDMFVECTACQGQRFNLQTLQVRYADLSIADVLAMPIREACHAFRNFSRIHATLKSLEDVGLGYLPLGQPSTTLSGGEAQRIKLATELSKKNTGNTVYLLDEPTTGLHFEDIRQLLLVLQQLVDAGNTVIVIEHNLDVIKSADWIVDMGPEGGDGGGSRVAMGTPEEVAAVPESFTGRYLKEVLACTDPA